LLNRYWIEIKYISLACLLLGGLVLLDRVDAFAPLDGFVAEGMDAMSQLGFIGMFILALIGNSSLLIQVPYSVPIISFALNDPSLGPLLILGLGAGLGAGFGEIISYLIADKVLAHNPDLPKSSLYQWVQKTVESHPRSTPFLIFIWAASLLPDDTILIPLAMIQYGLKRIAVPLFLGKVAHNLVLAVILSVAAEEVSGRTSAEVQTDLALGVLIVFVLVIFYQVERAKVMARRLAADVPPIQETL
jgi:hypothetical protein